MRRLATLCGILAFLIGTACRDTRKAEPKPEPRGSDLSQQSQTESSEQALERWLREPVLGQDGVSAPRRVRAYALGPGYFNGELTDAYCTELAYWDVDAERMLWFKDGQAVDLHVPDAWPMPRTFRSVWHDLCSYRAMAAGDSANLVPYVAPDPAEVGRRFAPGQTLYWMAGKGERCVAVRVVRPPFSALGAGLPSSESDDSVEAFVSRVGTASSGLRAMLPYSDDDSFAIPFVVHEPGPGQHAYVYMGSWQQQEHGAWRPLFKCRCERLLRIMKLKNSVGHMLGRRLPSDPVRPFCRPSVPKGRDAVDLYDQREVERWFWDRASCEASRMRAREAIERDGRRSVESGFYSGFEYLD